MKRLTVLVAFTLGMAGCGGDDGNAPSVSQVTVTVRQGTAAVTSEYVQESTAANSASDLGTIINYAITDSSGQATFTVPRSTSTGNLCFSSYLTWSGGNSFVYSCKSLNELTATVALNHP